MPRLVPVPAPADTADNAPDADQAKATGAKSPTPEHEYRPRLREADREARELSGRMLAQAMATAACSRQRMATAAGVSKAVVSRWIDGEARLGTDRIIHALTGSDAVARRAALGFLDQLAVVGKARQAPTVQRSPEHHALRIGSLVGDLQREVGEALADGVISTSEATSVRRGLDDIVRAAQAAARDIRPTDTTTD